MLCYLLDGHSMKHKYDKWLKPYIPILKGNSNATPWLEAPGVFFHALIDTLRVDMSSVCAYSYALIWAVVPIQKHVFKGYVKAEEVNCLQKPEHVYRITDVIIMAIY